VPRVFGTILSTNSLENANLYSCDFGINNFYFIFYWLGCESTPKDTFVYNFLSPRVHFHSRTYWIIFGACCLYSWNNLFSLGRAYTPKHVLQYIFFKVKESSSTPERSQSFMGLVCYTCGIILFHLGVQVHPSMHFGSFYFLSTGIQHYYRA